MILKIRNIDRFVENLHQKYLNYKKQGKKYWAKAYFQHYEKANKYAQKIERLSSKIEDKGVWGMEYHIEFEFLDDYLDFYDDLINIPKGKIDILSPYTFYIEEETTDFSQTE